MDLNQAFDALRDLNVSLTGIDFKCQGENCDETCSIALNEFKESDEVVAEACDLYSWDAERILCECCAKKADDIAAEDAHWIEKQEQERGDAA